MPPRLFRLCLLTAVLATGFIVTIGPPLDAQQQAAQPSLRLTRPQLDAYRRARSDRQAFVENEVLVKFKPGAAPADQGRALAVLRRDRRDPVATGWIGDTLLVEVPAGSDAEAAAAVLVRQPEVEWAQPNHVRRLSARPTDPDYALQWNFDLIEMPAAWDINPGANDTITVGVIDTGITTVNESFQFRVWTGRVFETLTIPYRISPDLPAARVLPGRDFIFWNGPVLDMVGHGTHVASTILEETNNTVGVAGMAYKAKLLPLKACIGFWEIQIVMSAAGEPGFPDTDDGGCSDSAVAQALRYAADQGAQVINISLGGEGEAPIIRDALQYAVSRGSFVAIAVGNEFDEGNPIEYPAAYARDMNGVVAVGAVGRSSRRAYYSNTGAHVELMAPGGDVRDGGLGGAVYQVSLLETDFDPERVFRPRFDRYTAVPNQGTSMATPHVSGAAALLRAQGITNPAAIESALERFAQDLGPAGRDNEYGFGLIKPRATLRGMGLAR